MGRLRWLLVKRVPSLWLARTPSLDRVGLLSSVTPSSCAALPGPTASQACATNPPFAACASNGCNKAAQARRVSRHIHAHSGTKRVASTRAKQRRRWRMNRQQVPGLRAGRQPSKPMPLPGDRVGACVALKAAGACGTAVVAGCCTVRLSAAAGAPAPVLETSRKYLCNTLPCTRNAANSPTNQQERNATDAGTSGLWIENDGAASCSSQLGAEEPPCEVCR